MNNIKTLTKTFLFMEIRNKQSVIMGTLLPVIMLILMGIAGRSESRGDMSYMAYILPGILGMSYASTGLIAFPIMLSSYRENGFLKFLTVTPIRISKVILSLVITQLIIMFCQTILLLFFCNFILNLGLNYEWNSIFWLISILFLSAVSLVFIGLVISIVCKNVKNTSTCGNISNLVLTFLGGAFFPTDVWPIFLQPLIKINPITHLVEILRNSLLFSTFSISDAINNIMYLSLVIIVSFILSFRFFSYQA